MTVVMPKWMTRRDNGVIVIDPDGAYPEILAALKVEKKDWDQYWIEVAYQCAKLEVMRIIHGTEFDPRPAKSLVIHIESRKDTWALAKFKSGRGAVAASKGGGAREHYKKWREFIPE